MIVNFTHSDDILPLVSHWIPFHPQKFTSWTQKLSLRADCASLDALSNTARSAQNWIAFAICCVSDEFPSSKVVGTACRTERHVEQGYWVGLDGAFTVNWVKHCCASADSTCPVEPVAFEVPNWIGAGDDEPYTRTLRATVFPSRYRITMIRT